MIALIEQIKNCVNYKPNMNVYTIVVLTSGDKHKKDILIHDFRPQDLKGNYINETPHKIIYLAPKYLNDKTPKQYQKWLQIIKDSLTGLIDEDNYENDKITNDIFTAIKDDNINPTDAFKIIDEHSDAELMVDIKNEGIEEGIKKGISRGEKNRNIEIAKLSLAQGLDIKTISSITGLTEEEIIKI